MVHDCAPRAADHAPVSSARGRAWFVAGRPTASEGRQSIFDLFPRGIGVKVLQPAPSLAMPTQRSRLFCPAAATGCTRLQVVMAGEAQNEEVFGGVVTAPEYPETVMDVELSLGGGYATDLAAGSSLGDELLAASRRQFGRT